jgi:carboxymethylenebutenolidase
MQDPSILSTHYREERMNDTITIDTRDGSFSAYLARPAAASAPAIVVIQEIFGVNADLRDTCDELALQGYLAISPDLF